MEYFAVSESHGQIIVDPVTLPPYSSINLPLAGDQRITHPMLLGTNSIHNPHDFPVHVEGIVGTTSNELIHIFSYTPLVFVQGSGFTVKFHTPQVPTISHVPMEWWINYNDPTLLKGEYTLPTGTVVNFGDPLLTCKERD